MRITPCVAGCWGPKLTSMSWVRTSSANSRSPLSSSVASAGTVGWLMRACARLLAGDAVVLLGEHVVLAQRVAQPVVGQQHVARIGMADEGHAEHLRALALVPLRRAIDDRAGRQARRGLGQEALDREALAMAQREHLHADPQVGRVLRRIRGRQVDQQLEAQALVVAAGLQEVRELLRVDLHEGVAGATLVLLV